MEKTSFFEIIPSAFLCCVPENQHPAPSLLPGRWQAPGAILPQPPLSAWEPASLLPCPVAPELCFTPSSPRDICIFSPILPQTPGKEPPTILSSGSWSCSSLGHGTCTGGQGWSHLTFSSWAAGFLGPSSIGDSHTAPVTCSHCCPSAVSS